MVDASPRPPSTRKNEYLSGTGDLVRIGPNEVIASDIDVLRRMSAPRSTYTRGPWYGTFRFWPDLDHSFSTRDEEKHTALRTKLLPGYSGTNLIEKKIITQVERLVRLIDRKFLSTDTDFRPIEFASISHIFSMDVIGDITYGKAFGFLDNGEDIFGYLKWNEDFFPIMMTVSTLPWLTSIFYKWPFILLFPNDKDKVGLGRFIAWVMALLFYQATFCFAYYLLTTFLGLRRRWWKKILRLPTTRNEGT